jgi:hypothetical protein
MGKSLICRVDAGLRLVIAYAMCMSTAWAEINLDALTACGDISALDKSLRSEQMPASIECRSPDGPLERAILQRVGGQDAKLCFHSSPLRPSWKATPAFRGHRKLALRSIASAQRARRT